NGQHPIRQPWTAHVYDRKQTRLDNRKNGHSLGRTVDRHSPFLPKQQQYRRNKCSGVPDTYPPYKVGNIPGPANGFVQSPSSNTCRYRVDYTANPPKECYQGNGKCNPPMLIGIPFNRSGYIHRYIVVALIS